MPRTFNVVKVSMSGLPGPKMTIDDSGLSGLNLQEVFGSRQIAILPPNATSEEKADGNPIGAVWRMIVNDPVFETIAAIRSMRSRAEQELAKKSIKVPGLGYVVEDVEHAMNADWRDEYNRLIDELRERSEEVVAPVEVGGGGPNPFVLQSAPRVVRISQLVSAFYRLRIEHHLAEYDQEAVRELLLEIEAGCNNRLQGLYHRIELRLCPFLVSEVSDDELMRDSIVSMIGPAIVSGIVDAATTSAEAAAICLEQIVSNSHKPTEVATTRLASRVELLKMAREMAGNCDLRGADSFTIGAQCEAYFDSLIKFIEGIEEEFGNRKIGLTESIEDGFRFIHEAYNDFAKELHEIADNAGYTISVQRFEIALGEFAKWLKSIDKPAKDKPVNREKFTLSVNEDIF